GRTGDSKPPVKESNRGSFIRAARVLLKSVYNPKEERRYADGTEFKTFKSVHPTATFQDEVAHNYLQNDPQKGLYDQHRPQRCFSTRIDQQNVQKVSQVYMGRSHLPVQGATIWSIFKPTSIHKNTKTSTEMGQSSRDTNVELLRRFVNLRINKNRVSKVHKHGIQETGETGIPDQPGKVINTSQTMYYASWDGHQQPSNEFQDTQTETQRFSERGIQVDTQRAYNTEGSGIIHWQNAGSEYSTQTRTTDEQEVVRAQKKTL
ncbi:hypothetical protein AX774_g2922, partial [Zancudomyces culisetae]